MNKKILLGIIVLSAMLLTPGVSSAHVCELPDDSNPPYEAVAGDVLISEIAWAGSSRSNADEWIELTNTTDQVIDLSHWSLSGAAGSSGSLTLPDGAGIGPGETFLIGNYSEDHDNAAVNSTIDYVTTQVSISNSSLAMVLADASGQEIDAAGDTSAPFAGGTGTSGDDNGGVFRTMERISSQDGTNPNAWADATTAYGFDAGVSDLGTPGLVEEISDELPDEEPADEGEDESDDEENQDDQDDQDEDEDDQDTQEGGSCECTCDQPPQTGLLMLNELYANTSGSDTEEEFIEVYNPTGDDVELTGWSVMDESGKTFTFDSGTLAAGEYLEISRPESKIALNNDGDTLELFDPNGNLTDSVSYEDAPQGSSYSKFDEGWQYSTTLTPGEANILSGDQSTDSGNDDSENSDLDMVNLEDLSSMEDGDRVKTSGLVLVSPGVLGKQIFYIGDQDTGIQVYKHDSEFPTLNEGDEVVLSGELSTSQGQRRLKVTSTDTIELTGSFDSPNILNLDLSEVSEEQVGVLITTSGSILSRSDKDVVLEKDGVELTVRVYSTTGIDLAQFTRGSDAGITGILSTYNGTLRLLPRSQSDVIISENTSNMTAGIVTGKDLNKKMNSNIAKITAIATLAFLGAFALRKVKSRMANLYAKSSNISLSTQKSD